MKRIIFAIAAAAMIAGGVGLFYAALHINPHASSSSNNKKTMFLDHAASRLAVDPDGILTVTETLSYDLGDVAWRGLYQDVILGRNERVLGVRVVREDGGVPAPLAPGSGIVLGVGGAYGSFGWGLVNDPTRRLRIVWNVADTGKHTFVVRYKLAGAVRNHADASSLLWDAWGSGWETGVAKLDVNVRFPGRIKLFQPRTDHLQRRVSRRRVRGNTGSFTVSGLPARNTVQVQAAAAPLRGMPREAGAALPRLRAEQLRIARNNADYARRSAELLARSWVSLLILALTGTLVAVLLVALAWLTLGRDTTKPVSAGGVYQYPPEKIPAPVIARALGFASTDQLVSAVLLSMLQRDVFRVIPAEQRKEDVAIMNIVGEQTFNPAKLQPWEAPIAELLQSAIDKHERHAPDFLELKKILDASFAETKIKQFTTAVSAEMHRYGLRATYRGRVRRWLIGLLSLALYAVALIAVLGSTGNDAAARWDETSWALYAIGFAPVMLWAAIEGNAFYRLKADQAERVRKWETYQDFFRNMDLSREYPLTVEIWDEALVYAAAFGFADKVITNMPRVDEAGQPVGFGEGNFMWLGYASSMSTFDGITSGISGVTGLSTSSSSSGGFSGGASGGGGGGGW